FRDPEIVAKVSRRLGEPMVGIAAVPESERLADRGW
ncbi:MAG TPA: pyridoxal 5'-phosphate synthase lyase subunit PdxS, partial [Actinomycetes bacterium]|nr:pyridoxal 5'-phosphate synthase lyase subunit PdxS [Actinomycetes bacterium]